MAIKRFLSLIAALQLLVFTVATNAQSDLQEAAGMQFFKNGFSQNSEQRQSDVIEEEPESLDPKERALRKAKNIRHNAGGSDLTIRKPNTEHFIEHIWPRGLPLIPSSESAVIVSGTVIRMQPYLSEDRSRIYTEIAVKIEEVLKSDVTLSVGDLLIVDRLGGVLKLKSGHVVRYDISIKGLGKTRVGGRYVLFAQRVREGKDIDLIKGYELRDGKVFRLTEDGSIGNILVSIKPGVPDVFSEERAFLEAVRQEVGDRKKTGGDAS
jgi:hypothetical protein